MTNFIDKKWIERIYNLEISTNPILVGRAQSSNSSYFLKTNRGSFVLKCYKPNKTEQKVIFEHKVISQVSKYFPRVQEIELPKNKILHDQIEVKETYFLYHNRICSLYKWVGDIQYDGGEIQLKNLGSVLGDFFSVLDQLKIGKKVTKQHHLQLDKDIYKRVIDRALLLDNVDVNVIRKNIKLLCNSIDFYNDLYVSKKEVIHSVPNVIIHGDLNSDNIGFMKNGQVSKIRDFEFTRYSYRFFDIGWLLVSFCSGKMEFDHQKLDTLIDSLSEKYELTEEILQLGLLSVIYKVIKYTESLFKKIVEQQVSIQESFFNEHFCYLQNVLAYLSNKK